MPAGAILLVEDDDAVRSSVARLLRASGYEVCEAADGAEALRCLASASPIALIVLDLEMPRLSGWTLRERQMNDPGLARIPTVVLSETALHAGQLKSLAARGVLTKPFLFEELLRFARAYVDRAH